MHTGRRDGVTAVEVAVASSAAQVCGRKRLGVANNGKNNPAVEAGVEHAIQAKKVAYKHSFRTKSNFLCIAVC